MDWYKWFKEKETKKFFDDLKLTEDSLISALVVAKAPVEIYRLQGRLEELSYIIGLKHEDFNGEEKNA